MIKKDGITAVKTIIKQIHSTWHFFDYQATTYDYCILLKASIPSFSAMNEEPYHLLILPVPNFLQDFSDFVMFSSPSIHWLKYKQNQGLYVESKAQKYVYIFNLLG